MTSARLARDARGGLVAVVTVPGACTPIGMVLHVLGNHLPAVEHGIGWLGPTGRPPSDRERLEPSLPSRDRRPMQEQEPDAIARSMVVAGEATMTASEEALVASRGTGSTI